MLCRSPDKNLVLPRKWSVESRPRALWSFHLANNPFKMGNRARGPSPVPVDCDVDRFVDGSEVTSVIPLQKIHPILLDDDSRMAFFW